jgi:transglutaminase-like putative cysteine protease
MQHITLGWGRDYSDVSPIRGVLVGGGDHVLQVGVDVVALGTVETDDLVAAAEAAALLDG